MYLCASRHQLKQSNCPSMSRSPGARGTPVLNGLDPYMRPGTGARHLLQSFQRFQVGISSHSSSTFSSYQSFINPSRVVQVACGSLLCYGCTQWLACRRLPPIPLSGNHRLLHELWLLTLTLVPANPCCRKDKHNYEKDLF